MLKRHEYNWYNLCSRGVNIIQNATKMETNNTPQLFLIHTILDAESGKILEYWHLVKHPTYAEMWTKSYANKLG